jgi:hypothetical protein
MAINDYVEQILSSPVHIFDGIIEKLIGKNLHFAKIELRRHSFQLDAVLVESIKSVLKDLDNEEGVVSRFLYANFGFEIRKNKRREQLLYLGSELKVQHKKIMSKLYGIHRQKERLSYCIVDLKRLAEGFHNKNMFFESNNIKNKNRFYIDEVEERIAELQKTELSLLMKHENLSEIEKIYHKLFKSIPRHENLYEETHLLLARPLKT